MDLIINVICEGLAYSILSLGVLITYHVLDYADLTVEGSFPLGAVIGAVCIVNGVNPFIALIMAFIGGVLAGYLTGFLNVKFRISSLLSGILAMTALYSINLIIASDTSNIPLFSYDTIFTYGDSIANAFDGVVAEWIIMLYPLIMLLFLALLMKLLIDWFFTTKYGFLLRISGDNPQLIASLGQNIGSIRMNGLALSNGYAALSGAVISQLLRYFDIQLGVGMIVMGLASVIMGITIFKRLSFISYTSSVVLGAIMYRGTIAIALNAGLPANYLKLIMALIFVSVLIIGNGVLAKFLRHKGVKR